MFRIRRFGVIKTANVVALLYLIIFAIIFVPILVLVAAVAPGAGVGGVGGNTGAVAVLFFGLLIALFYAVVGWIFTALAALLYNFAAGMIGGIEIQLEAVVPPTPVPAWGSASQPSDTTSAPPPAAPPAG